MIRCCNVCPPLTEGRNIEKWEWVFAKTFSSLIAIKIRSKKGSVKISQSMQSSAAYFQKSILFNLYHFILYPLNKNCQPWADINHESVPIHLLTTGITQISSLANKLNAISQIWLEVTKTWMSLRRENYHWMTILSLNTSNLRWKGTKEDIFWHFLSVDASLQALWYEIKDAQQNQLSCTFD